MSHLHIDVTLTERGAMPLAEMPPPLPLTVTSSYHAFTVPILLMLPLPLLPLRLLFCCRAIFVAAAQMPDIRISPPSPATAAAIALHMRMIPDCWQRATLPDAAVADAYADARPLPPRRYFSPLAALATRCRLRFDD